MYLKHLITAAGILLAIWGGILLYNFLFLSVDTSDSRIVAKTLEEIQKDPQKYCAEVKTLEVVEPGVYRLEVGGISDAHAAGQIGYNVMVTMIMANWDLQTPRNTFKIFGYQDGEMIFEVFATAGKQPEVTLHGPYEGIEYIPSFSKAPDPAPSDETIGPLIMSHA